MNRFWPCRCRDTGEGSPAREAGRVGRFLVALPWLLALLSTAACRPNPSGDPATAGRAADGALERLSGVTILFGHQSVGADILEGVREIADEHPGRAFAIISLPPSGQTAGHGLFEFLVGANGDPVGKIRDFGSRSFAGVDIALMKLCYVDFEPGTDVAELFREYVALMERLRTEHPATRFIHLTAPLTSRETGLKAWAKRALGRELWGDQQNLQRHRYNEMLRAEYGEQGTLFDLALLEATDPRGRIQEHALHGERFLAMHAGYTTDGGHLNEAGRRRIGQAYLEFLASAVAGDAAP